MNTQEIPHLHVMDRQDRFQINAKTGQQEVYCDIRAEVCTNSHCIDERHQTLLVRGVDVEKIVRDELQSFDTIWKAQMEAMRDEIWEEAYEAAMEYFNEG